MCHATHCPGVVGAHERHGGQERRERPHPRCQKPRDGWGERDPAHVELAARIESQQLSAIDAAETATAAGTTLHLRLAIDYSSRDALARAAAAAARAGAAPVTEDALGVALGAAYGAGAAAPDVDLLIRTGGERRLSDFLLWECAYAELYFTSAMWPEFGEEALREALRFFESRERRFGGVPAQAAS